jgi:TRAP-type C4-dicarboxylate transport system permease large subunit
MELPLIVMLFVIAAVIALTAGPLNGSATIIALGSISYAALVNAGIDPVCAVVAILIFASTGASPPSSAPIFISCSIAKLDKISETFKPLVFHYVIPIVLIGILIALGILPIVHP